MKALLKPYVPAWAFRVRAYLQSDQLSRSAWIGRTTTESDQHLTLYWNSDRKPNRLQLIDILSRHVDGSVLEYGSHVGVNFKVLRDRFPDATFYAVEPNKEAFGFMREKLPFVQGLNAEDEGFIATTSFPPHPVSVSFTSGVFNCMAPSRAKSVLEKLSRISNTIVLGEGIDHADGWRSRWIKGTNCYHHPYSRWLRARGFSNIEAISALDPGPNYSGVIIAKRALTRWRLGR